MTESVTIKSNQMPILREDGSRLQFGDTWESSYLTSKFAYQYWLTSRDGLLFVVVEGTINPLIPVSDLGLIFHPADIERLFPKETEKEAV